MDFLKLSGSYLSSKTVLDLSNSTFPINQASLWQLPFNLSFYRYSDPVPVFVLSKAPEPGRQFVLAIHLPVTTGSIDTHDLSNFIEIEF